MSHFIGDTEITAITNIDPSKSRPETNVKGLGTSPFDSQHSPDREEISITAMLIKDLHSDELGVDNQKDNIRSLVQSDIGDKSFTYRDYAGFLSVNNISLSMSGEMSNLREVTMEATYHPASTFRCAKLVKSSPFVNNDFGHYPPGLITIPSQARDVRVSVHKGGNNHIEPVERYVLTDTGYVDVYSVVPFMNGWNGDNSGVSTSLRYDYRGLVSTELSAQGDYTRPKRDGEHYTSLPRGDYRLRVRLSDSDQVDGDVRLKVEYLDGGWTEAHSETVTGTDNPSTLQTDRFRIPKNREVRFTVEKETSNTNTIEVDGGWIAPAFPASVTFDLDTYKKYDRAAIGYWPFETGHGNNAEDYSTKNQPMSFVGTPSWVDDSWRGDHAINLKATDYLETGALFSSSNNVTISMALKPDSLSQDFEVVSEGTAWGLSYDDSTDSWSATVEDIDNNTFSVSGGDPTVGEFNRLGLVYSSGVLKIYEDGVEVGSSATNNNKIRYSDSSVHIGDSAFEGVVDTVRAYPNDLSSEISNLHNKAESVEEMQSFSTNARVAPVEVYDHVGSTDESNWIRVMNENHKFDGGMVIQNGLIRYMLNDPDTNQVTMWQFHDGNWSRVGNFRFKPNGLSAATSVDRAHLVDVDEGVARITFDIAGENQMLELKRGNRYGKVGVSGLNRIKLSNDSQVDGGYIPDSTFYSPSDGQSVSVQSEVDNYISMMSSQDDAVYFAFTNSQDGRQKIDDANKRIGFDSLGTLKDYDIMFGAITMSEIQKFIHSGSPVSMEIGREIPQGEYVVASRAEFTDTADEWTFDVQNATDNSEVDIDGSGISKGVTETDTYSWFQRVIRVGGSDGDNLEVSWTQQSGTGSVNVESIMLIPVGKIQEITHEAMCDMEVEATMTQRPGVSR